MFQLFNGFNTLIGLLLAATAFIMQAQIDNACGSKPLKNSILGVLVIGMTMFWVAAMGLYSGVPMFTTKEMFAGFCRRPRYHSYCSRFGYSPKV